MILLMQEQIKKQNEISIYPVIPRNNEVWYGSAVRSATHGISIDRDAKQFHMDYLDLLLCSELTFGINQVKRRENNFIRIQ